MKESTPSDIPDVLSFEVVARDTGFAFPTPEEAMDAFQQFRLPLGPPVADSVAQDSPVEQFLGIDFSAVDRMIQQNDKRMKTSELK